MTNSKCGSPRAVQGLNRRDWLAGTAAMAGAARAWPQTTADAADPASHAHGHVHPADASAEAAVADDLVQPMLDLADRVVESLARLGEPVPTQAWAAIRQLTADGDLRQAASRALALLQSRVLLTATVTPEARVSVKSAVSGAASLVQGGWRVYLVKIVNPACVPGRLGASSPSAIPVNGLYPPEVHSGGSMGQVGAPTTRGDVALRWMDLEVHDAAPLEAVLQALPVDFKIVCIYARDPGLHTATIALDIGPGTGDIGGRDRASIAFDVQRASIVRLRIHDADGQPATCSLLITDSSGRVLPSQTRRSPPDMFFQQKIYRADAATVSLPPGSYRVDATRGPEYLLDSRVLKVSGRITDEWTFQLRRWVDPGARGWYSGDHHIHAAGCAHYEHPEEGVGPEMMAPQVLGEGLAIGSVLTWGPGFYTQKLHFSGRDDPVSTPGHILHYDLEVSGFPSSHCGHLALLQMKEMDYPGTRLIEEWPSSNAPVLRWARRQGAVTGYAHAGVGLWAGTTDLPNERMPAFDGIGANDYIVTLPEGLVDFISTCNHPPAAEMNIWYHTLNVGLRSRIAGETDWPCFFEENIGMGRSYVKLDKALSYAGWCEGLKAGRSYVSEGRAHLMDFAARCGSEATQVGGADLRLETSQVVTFTVDAAARLEPEPTAATRLLKNLAPLDKPYWHVERARVGDTRSVVIELIVNGYPVESRPLLADGSMQTLAFSARIERSTWVALRISNGAHTNPIWIDVGGKPIRVLRSARWCRAAVDQCWSQKKLRIRASEQAQEVLLYDRGREFYDRMIAEATS